MTDTVIAEVKNAMTAFEAFKTDLAPKLGKLDAFDAAKFDRIEADIATAIQTTQDEKIARKAAEDQQKALEGKSSALENQVKTLEGELTAVKAALNRPGAAAGDDKGKSQDALRKKLLNEFSRMRSENREDFSEYLAKRAVQEPELKALSVNSDASGGYLTMPDMGGIIQTRVFETSPMRKLASVITIGSDTYEVILDNDEASSGWVGETAPRPNTTTPVLGKLTIYCNEMYSNPKASQKILDDAGIDIEAWLGQKVADKFARDEATGFMVGNGVNKPKGLLSYDAGTTLSSQQIEQIATGSASTFTYDGLVDLQNALKEAYQSNAVFLLQRATNRHLMKIKDGEGQPIFNMNYDKNVGLEPTLMSRPFYFAADMPAATTNALALAYGDIRSAYQIVDRTGIRVLRDPYTDKPNVAFYTTKRVGGGVVNFEAVKLAKVAAS